MKAPTPIFLLFVLSVAVAAIIVYNIIVSNEVLAQVTSAAAASSQHLALVHQRGGGGQGGEVDDDKSRDTAIDGAETSSGIETRHEIDVAAGGGEKPGEFPSQLGGEVAAAYLDRLERQGIQGYQAMLDEYAATTALRRDGPTVAYVCASKR